MRTARHLWGIASALFITGLALSEPAVATECNINKTALANNTMAVQDGSALPENIRWYLGKWQGNHWGQPGRLCTATLIYKLDTTGKGQMLYAWDNGVSAPLDFQIENGKFTVTVGPRLVITFEPWDHQGKRLLYGKTTAQWQGSFHRVEQVASSN